MKEDSFCRAAHFRGTDLSPGRGGDQRGTCSAPTGGSQCRKVISACSGMLLTAGTIAPAQLLSAHTQAPSSPCLPQEMPRLRAASAMDLQHQPARAERSIPAMMVVKSRQVSHTGLYLPVPPAPPSYSLSRSGSEELSTTRNWLVGMKTKPQSLEGGFFSKPSKAKGDRVSWLSREISQRASAQHLLEHLFQSQDTKIALAVSGAAFLLHILLLPCPYTAPNPFLFLTMSSKVSK